MTRLFPIFTSLVIFVAGFTALGAAERSLWRNAPAESLDRYAIDRVLPEELPPVVTEDELWLLCDRPWWSHLWQARSALAACLGRDVGGHAHVADAPSARWQVVIDSQIAYAGRVESIPFERVQTQIQSLRALRLVLLERSGGPLLPLFDAIGADRPVHEATLTPPPVAAADVALIRGAFVFSRNYTEGRRHAIGGTSSGAGTADGAWRTARDTGLLAAGLSLDYDNARATPEPHIVVDHDSLGGRLDRARRAMSHAVNLELTLSGWLAMMTASGLLAVLVAGMIGASPVLVACLFIFAGRGAIHLVDVAVTGPAALRHLPTRDFGEGFGNAWGYAGGMIWGPATVFLVALLASRLASRHLHRATDRLLRLPTRVIAIGMVAVIAVALSVPASPALRTEILAFVTAAGSAIFVARYAPLMGIGANGFILVYVALPLICAALTSATLGALVRVDPLGTLAVFVITGLVMTLLVSNGWTWRTAILVLLVAVVWTYAHFLATGQDVTGVIDRVLPGHGRTRFLAVYDPLAHGMPDIKQVEWLVRSGMNPGTPAAGWGFGNVPWSGFPGNGRAQALPIPAVSDLSAVLLATVGGATYAFSVLASLVAVLLMLIQRGFAGTFGTEVRLSERFLSATGAIGLLAVVLRIIVNVAGTFQVLPLAGVPIAFLAHAPAATNFALAYAGILLGAASGRRSGITETAP